MSDLPLYEEEGQHAPTGVRLCHVGHDEILLDAAEALAQSAADIVLEMMQLMREHPLGNSSWGSLIWDHDLVTKTQLELVWSKLVDPTCRHQNAGKEATAFVTTG